MAWMHFKQGKALCGKGIRKIAVKRHECLKEIAGSVGDALVVVCVGGTSSEWNAYRPSDGNLRCWTLGLTSSVALGMALGLPHRRVIALDGDGSLLMNLCGLPTIMRKNPKNLKTRNVAVLEETYRVYALRYPP